MSAEWVIGDLLEGRFQIHDVRRGAAGLVYAVYDRELKQALAAKMLEPELLRASPPLAERFVGQARAWLRLPSHPHVVEARFIHHIDGAPVLFEELLTGGDLGTRIGTGFLTEVPQRVVALAIQFCDAMIHAAAHGVAAHGNIKPSNCLLTARGTLKLSDFGFGAALYGFAPQTAAGHGLAGVFAYLAPERFDAGSSGDTRADIYAFGVMLYEMLTGALPIIAASIDDYRAQQARAIPALGSRYGMVGRIVETCLAREPEKRFRDFRVVRAILVQAHRELTGAPPAAEPAGSGLEVEQLANRAAALAALERYAQALELLAEASRRAPANAHVWASKGLVAARLGDAHEARLCLERAVAFDPLDARAWRGLGALERQAQRPREALVALEHSLAAEPHDFETWMERAMVLQVLGRDEDALDSCHQALKRNPRCVPAFLQQAGIHRRRGNTDSAIDCLKRALGLSPLARDTWKQLAQLYRDSQRREEELLCHERVLAVDPDDEELLNRRGVLLGELGRFEEELACLDRVLQVNPESSEGWFNRAVALVHLGRPAEAELALQHAERRGHAHAANARAALRETMH
jgi:tetratricopeptide (TPR) repeat protein